MRLRLIGRRELIDQVVGPGAVLGRGGWSMVTLSRGEGTIKECAFAYCLLDRRLHEPPGIIAEFTQDLVMIGLFDRHRLQAGFGEPH